MTLIEGIGDEVVQFFVGLFFVLVVVLAWCTTNTTNDGTFRTVFLLERRRLRAVRRLITHTESSTIVEGTTEENSNTNQTSATTGEDKPTSTSADSRRSSAGEETRIVEAMDAPNCLVTNGLRKRINSNVNTGDGSNTSSIDDDSTIGTNVINHTGAAECSDPEMKAGSSREKGETEKINKIRVKLKYVTDELRLVEADLKENIGDFRRRNFQVELAANKIVKLIFNGHILQREEDTLQSCGLFDNCVVHCVFLPKTNSPSQGTGSSSRGSNAAPHGTDSHSNNHNQQNEWHLENYLLAILCWFLGAAWYLRYAYSQLYTVTATIGLILMTGIFTIIMFGIHFPENEELNNQQRENARTQ